MPFTTTAPASITVDGVAYVRAPEPLTEDWVLVRSRDAGVFVGRLDGRHGAEVRLMHARRIWRWDGAATLSQLAIDGTSKPDTCKFPPPVPEITVLGVCEIIPMTAKAVASIQAVKDWRE